MNCVIADSHGGSRTFDVLLNQINLCHADRLYLPGDYVDRGPDSKGVLFRPITRFKLRGKKSNY